MCTHIIYAYATFDGEFKGDLRWFPTIYFIEETEGAKFDDRTLKSLVQMRVDKNETKDDLKLLLSFGGADTFHNNKDLLKDLSSNRALM